MTVAPASEPAAGGLPGRAELEAVLLPFRLRRAQGLPEPSAQNRTAPAALVAEILTLLGEADRPGPAGESTQSGLAGFAELVAAMICDAVIRADLNDSRARIVAAVDESRRRVERDLHDGAQQRLATLALQLRAAASDVTAEPEELRDVLARAADDVTAALDEVREIAR